MPGRRRENATRLVLLALVLFVPLMHACAAPGASSAGAAGEGPPAEERVRAGEVVSRTVWDGVFTGAQARAGQSVAQSHCDRCHANEGWPFVVEAWSGRRLVDFFDMIRTDMPLDYPGALRSEEYTAVIAYILRLSGAATGGRELPSDREVLAGITM